MEFTPIEDLKTEVENMASAFFKSLPNLTIALVILIVTLIAGVDYPGDCLDGHASRAGSGRIGDIGAKPDFHRGLDRRRCDCDDGDFPVRVAI